jgi:hypothetical protein
MISMPHNASKRGVLYKFRKCIHFVYITVFSDAADIFPYYENFKETTRNSSNNNFLINTKIRGFAAIKNTKIRTYFYVNKMDFEIPNAWHMLLYVVLLDSAQLF